MNSYIPITEQKQETKIPNFYDDSSSSPTECGPCGCFNFTYFNWAQAQAHEVHSRSLLQDKTEHKESWLVIKIKILKNLLRKIGKMYRKSKKSKAYQYDAESYALNFDDGARVEEDGLLCNFSSRFAVNIINQKQSRHGL
ncbi:hypothetical protein RND71_037529 [Anisodus tanguticus]|uniref:Uncharacterized protein n=1 Tax=Anisodus tanguticus TaxID=243964 RepID=A0AAE1R304_9SOLA|nr:hypothetical protein RND71_037529 [Anisodus tanguticus]